jgi:hypothetical protein
MPARRSTLDIRLSKLMLFAAVLSLLISLMASPTGAVDRSVWQLTPYRVQIAVAGDSLFGSAAETAAFCSGLETQLEAVVGASWKLTVTPAPSDLRWVQIESLESLAPDGLLKAAPDADKIFLLVAEETQGVLRAAVRELDVRTRHWGPVVSRTVLQRAKLRDAAADVVLQSFSPLAMIDSADLKKGRVVLRLKAAALPARDPKLAFVRAGSLFQPIVRYNDRDGKLRKADPLAWTVLAAESVSPDQVICKLYSGSAAPPISRSRARMELLALGVRPTKSPSILRLNVRTGSKSPLVGYEIYEPIPSAQAAAPSPGQDVPPPKLNLLGRTDAQGEFAIQPIENPLRLVVIKNGERTLSRPLPLVQGVETDLRAEFGSDDARLQMEGIMTSLLNDLIDTMGRRIILQTRIRASMKKGDFTKAEQLLQELRTLPDNQKFRFRLADEKKRFASPDRNLQKKMDRLLGEMQKTIDKHLTTADIDDLEAALQKAQGGAK